MNAAARLLNQGALSRSWVLNVMWIQFQWLRFALIMAVLVSALGLIYVTNTERELNANLQQSFVERDRLHVQWGQLLLEKSTLMTQARVQAIAEDQLNMIIPEGKAVVVIE